MRKERARMGHPEGLSGDKFLIPLMAKAFAAQAGAGTMEIMVDSKTSSQTISGPKTVAFGCSSAEFLGESDEESFRPPYVAEPIRVLVLNYFAYELCPALAESFKRLVDVVHGEHDAEVA